mmetsp:Transcript_51476/g.122577  ORF Transcript_51476/g.122577 Transcript_51476/m.122577 type:complete len:252 (+) Transcript_51476:567-1322(+)
MGEGVAALVLVPHVVPPDRQHRTDEPAGAHRERELQQNRRCQPNHVLVIVLEEGEDEGDHGVLGELAFVLVVQHQQPRRQQHRREVVAVSVPLLVESCRVDHRLETLHRPVRHLQKLFFSLFRPHHEPEAGLGESLVGLFRLLIDELLEDSDDADGDQVLRHFQTPLPSLDAEHIDAFGSLVGKRFVVPVHLQPLRHRLQLLVGGEGILELLSSRHDFAQKLVRDLQHRARGHGEDSGRRLAAVEDAKFAS